MKSKNRFTKARKALLEVLKDRHLTFKEIQKELTLLGFHNVSTLYNNLEFFMNNGMIIEFDIDGTKYYDLGSDNPYHKNDNHLHFVYKNPETKETVIEEFDVPDVYELIKSYAALKGFKTEYIRILVSGKKIGEK